MKIKHILADGTVLDSIEGYEVDITKLDGYEAIKRAIEKAQEEKEETA